MHMKREETRGAEMIGEKRRDNNMKAHLSKRSSATVAMNASTKMKMAACTSYSRKTFIDDAWSADMSTSRLQTNTGVMP